MSFHTSLRMTLATETFDSCRTFLTAPGASKADDARAPYNFGEIKAPNLCISTPETPKGRFSAAIRQQ
jgi:hypothetical protein